MPYRDPGAKRTHNRAYYHEKIKPKRGRPAVEDKRVLLGGVRIRSSITGRVQRILLDAVASGTYAYRTSSQIYEDLIVRGMGTLTSSDVVDEALQYLRAVSATDAIGAHRREAQAAFSRVRTELNELLQIKADQAAVHYYWTTVKAFASMSQNVWRDWFLRQMEKTFPQLARTAPRGVTLGLDDEPTTMPKSKKSRRRA